MSILDLPKDVVGYLCEFMNFRSLLALKSTCAYLHRLVKIKNFKGLSRKQLALINNEIISLYPDLNELYFNKMVNCDTECLKNLCIKKLHLLYSLNNDLLLYKNNIQNLVYLDFYIDYANYVTHPDIKNILYEFVNLKILNLTVYANNKIHLLLPISLENLTIVAGENGDVILNNIKDLCNLKYLELINIDLSLQILQTMNVVELTLIDYTKYVLTEVLKNQFKYFPKVEILRDYNYLDRNDYLSYFPIKKLYTDKINFESVSYMPNLTHLTIYDENFNNVANFPNLTHLYFNSNLITDDELIKLKNLICLFLGKLSVITNNGIKQLHKLRYLYSRSKKISRRLFNKIYTQTKKEKNKNYRLKEYIEYITSF